MNKNYEIENSTIFVTGGAGFVGSYLVEDLLQYNPKKIIILDNLLRGSLYNIKVPLQDKRVEFIEGDIRNTPLLRSIMSKTDYLFHLAALRITACAADPREAFDVMLKSTFELFELAKEFSIKKVIYSSTASVYGLAQTFPTPESDNPYNNQTFYGAAKSFGEGLLRNYFHSYGLDYVALRYFNIYGPRMDIHGKYTEVMIKWLDCIRDNKNPLIYGDGSTSMDFIHVKDVAHANILALKSNITDQVYNIGSQTETSLKQLLDILIEVNNCDLQPQFREENSINPVSRRLANITKAKKDLNFSAKINLKEGLSHLSKWYFKEQLTKLSSLNSIEQLSS